MFNFRSSNAMLHWGWFVLLLQTLSLALAWPWKGLGLDTNGLINITETNSQRL